MSDSWDPKDRVFIVTDDDDRARRFLRLVEEAALVPVIVRLGRAHEIRPPLLALILDIRPDAVAFAYEDVLLGWARIGLPPLSVISLAPERGAGQLAGTLKHFNYSRFVFDRPGPRPEGRYWTTLRSEIETIRELDLHFVPAAVSALGRHDRLTVRLLNELCVPPECARASALAKRLGYPTSAALAVDLKRRALPSTKRTLDLLRVARVTYLAGYHKWTRSTAAVECAFGMPDYLGKKVKRLTGRSFGELRAAGVHEALRSLRSA